MQSLLSEDTASAQEIDRIVDISHVQTTQTDSLGILEAHYEFDADLYTTSADSINQLLQILQTKFSDKTVILDVWATWCAPCIKEMKEATEAKQNIKEAGGELVYICVEQNTTLEKWKRKVAEIKTNGTHIFLHKGLTEQLLQQLSIRVFATYIIIPKDGSRDPAYVHSIYVIDIENLK